jgi:hypothetical protein
MCALLKFSKEDSTMKGSSKVDIQRLAQEFELMKKSIDKLTDQVRMVRAPHPLIVCLRKYMGVTNWKQCHQP